MVLVGGCSLSSAASGHRQESSQAASYTAPSDIHAFGFEILSGADAKNAGAIEKLTGIIRQRWFANPLLNERFEKHSIAAVDFVIDRNGRAEKVSLQQSTGDTILDNAAVSAVKDSSPFPNVFPAKFKGAKLRVIFAYHLPSAPTRPSCEAFRVNTYKRVGGKITPPKALYEPDPEFSEEARKQRYQGTMVLGLTVEPEGTASEICVEQGLGMGLDEKAIGVVEKWKFQPAMEDGVPVPVRIMVEVDFRLY
jgi:TonB family protein